MDLDVFEMFTLSNEGVMKVSDAFIPKTLACDCLTDMNEYDADGYYPNVYVMLRCMLKFAQEDKDVTILPADDPRHFAVGYVAYYMKGEEEVAKEFYVRLSTIKRMGSQNPLANIFRTPQDRMTLANIDNLRCWTNISPSKLERYQPLDRYQSSPV